MCFPCIYTLYIKLFYQEEEVSLLGGCHLFSTSKAVSACPCPLSKSGLLKVLPTTETAFKCKFKEPGAQENLKNAFECMVAWH